MSEYGTAVVGLEMLRSVNEESAEESRKEHIVQSAIGTLSFSELEAIIHIFDELNGTEGILVASKIADRVGITRSVIVNALRKFESAGVIESQFFRNERYIYQGSERLCIYRAGKDQKRKTLIKND